jgi:hypothetical protein
MSDVIASVPVAPELAGTQPKVKIQINTRNMTTVLRQKPSMVRIFMLVSF